MRRAASRRSRDKPKETLRWRKVYKWLSYPFTESSFRFTSPLGAGFAKQNHGQLLRLFALSPPNNFIVDSVNFMTANNLSILVVDDDDDTRTLVKTILTSNGFSVRDARDGTEALNTLKEFKPSLVVLDIMMPGLSGYDVVVQMKQKPETQNIPIIMLTAKADPDDVLSGYKDYGVEYYITKPFTTRQLLAGVKLVLDME